MKDGLLASSLSVWVALVACCGSGVVAPFFGAGARWLLAPGPVLGTVASVVGRSRMEAAKRARESADNTKARGREGGEGRRELMLGDSRRRHVRSGDDCSACQDCVSQAPGGTARACRCTCCLIGMLWNVIYFSSASFLLMQFVARCKVTNDRIKKKKE